MAKYQLTLPQYTAKIIAAAHVLEKGMSLSQPRPGFGQEKAASVVDFLEHYRTCGFPLSAPVYRDTVHILKVYRGFSIEHAAALNPHLQDRIDLLPTGETSESGYRTVQRADLEKAMCGDFAMLASSRASFRDFTDVPVDPEKVRQALEIARHTPSVCNRQCWQVYWIRDPSLKDVVLKLQEGGRGFGERADSFLIVTADLQSFMGTEERNQAYVDGGLYAMTLIYALHFLHIGTCAMNWSKLVTRDHQLREAVSIPNCMAIIMMIGIGNLPETLRVAASCRKTVQETLTEV
jgi:nitroreductase